MTELTDEEAKALLAECDNPDCLTCEYARALLDTRAELDRVKVAALAEVKALVVEQAAEIARVRAEQHADMALNGLPENARLREAMEAAFTDMRWAISALAPASGVEALETLRAERDRMNQWRETAIVERDTYSQERDEAQAAQAGVCEQANALLKAAIELAEYASYAEIVGGISVNGPQIRRECDAVFSAIRNLPEDQNFEPSFIADPTGVALLAELRAERDGWREGSRVQAMASESLRAERDRLAAANAVLEAKVAGLRDFVDDFAKAKIDALRSSPPYGSSPEDDPDPVVDAETVWAWQADAKAALATQEAGTC